MRVTASVGLAESSVGMPGRELIARADYALYRAKRDGKNRVRTLGPDETIHPSGRQNLEGSGNVELRSKKDNEADGGR
jgi:predicted signal transduction protein with EAL and GGDEF domain